jgi:hypothetical protein
MTSNAAKISGANMPGILFAAWGNGDSEEQF